MTAFFPWPSIGKLSDIRPPSSGRVSYRPKVKLHGTHAAIRIDSVQHEGTVTAQSRTRDLTVGEDNFGFASWVEHYSEALTPWHEDRVLYGEWYGPGVQKGVALSEVGRRKFAVYAARYGSVLVTEPALIRRLCDELPCHVLPWYGPVFVWDFSSPDEALLARLNSEVDSIDKCCPWAYEMHGIEGTGEGLVMYPYSSPERDSLELAWKAKGATHRQSAGKPITARAVASADVISFVEAVLTESRLDQAVVEACGCLRKPEMTSQFLRWIGNNVLRECANELTASGLEWKQVAKTLASRAGRWYNRAA